MVNLGHAAFRLIQERHMAQQGLGHVQVLSHSLAVPTQSQSVQRRHKAKVQIAVDFNAPQHGMSPACASQHTYIVGVFQQ